jgi:D-inositol-3-phosphate glycosyltransferase
MNILQVGTAGIKIPPQKYGAIELYIYSISRHMLKAGHSVTVVDIKEAKADPDIEYIDGIKFIRLHTKTTIASSRNFIVSYVQRRINTLSFALKVSSYIKRGDFDIIHLHAILISLILVFLNRKLRGNMVYAVHSPAWFMSPMGWLDKLSLVLECYLMRRVSRVIAQTAPLKAKLVARGKIKPEKVVVLHTGAEIGEFSPEIDTGDIRERYGLEGRVTILFAGRIVPYKGVKYLVKAADIVVNNFGYKKALFLLIGPMAEHETDKAQYADYITKILNFIKNSALEANVKLTGAVPYNDLTRLLAAGDIFVLPSLAESFPAIVSQAMASAKPVIGTKVGGVPDQIKDGWNGYLVEPANEHQLADKIKFLIDYPEERQRMGLNGRKRAEEEFDWKRVTEQTLQVYQSMVKNG